MTKQAFLKVLENPTYEKLLKLYDKYLLAFQQIQHITASPNLQQYNLEMTVNISFATEIIKANQEIYG